MNQINLHCSQVAFVLILHPKKFFWEIWPQNLKFFKLAEIWYKGRLLYACFDFNVYFSKFFCHSYFLWAILVTKSKVLQIDWHVVQRYIVTYAYYGVNVCFFKVFVIRIFGGVIWSQNLKFSKLTKIWYRDQLLYTYCDFNVYFFKIFVSHIFLGKFGLKIRICPNGLKFGTGVHLLYAYYDFTVDFFKSFVIHIVLGKFGSKIWCSPT